MAGQSILRRLLKGGIMALLIKGGAAGFQFLMFLVLAQAMSAEEFGIFGFGFSLALLLAVGGSFGQRMLSLRFLSIYISEDKPALAVGRMREGAVIVTLGTVVVSVVACFGMALAQPELRWGFLALTAAFAVSMAWAEYFAFALRAYEKMTLALAPRDVIWRLLVCLAALPMALGWLGQIDADMAMMLLTGLLAGTVLVQIMLHPATRLQTLISAPAAYDPAAWRPAMWGLWGVSFVQIAAPNLTVVLLGILLTPAETGAVFAALRIALLMNLVLLAANMVVSPTVSRLYHEGRYAALQKTCSTIALVASASAGLVFVGLVIWGDWLLGLFGEGFEEGYAVLLIVAGAYVVNTLTGPTSVLLELSGHDRAALRILTGMNIVSMLAMVPMIWWLGAVGAALCLALSIAGWNIQAVVYARRKIGLDPSVAGPFFKAREP